MAIVKPSWKDISVGDVFKNNRGRTFEVVKVKSATEIVIRFESGYVTSTTAVFIRKGLIKDRFEPRVFGVGFIGDGEYSNKLNTKEYTMWSNMLQRCYYAKYKSEHPTYEDCLVIPEWHNFQNFVAWVRQEQKSSELAGFTLDKDIIKHGNKIYCPELCSLVPRELNSAYVGVSFAKGFYFDSRGYYVTSIRKNGMRKKLLGYFKDESSAREAYILAKQEYLSELALKYKDVISEKVFNVLTQTYKGELI